LLEILGPRNNFSRRGFVIRFTPIDLPKKRAGKSGNKYRKSEKWPAFV
jgi:hypothetical protein